MYYSYVYTVTYILLFSAQNVDERMREIMIIERNVRPLK